jgi:hypothetical protein
MRKVIVGATALQLAELDRLFPHQGGAAQAFDNVPSEARGHQRRQIQVGGYPQIVGGYQQIVGSDMPGVRHQRRQIVGAHVEEMHGQGNFVEIFLPLSGVAGQSITAGDSYTFELKPNRLFLPMALCLSTAVCANLVMTSLQIGGQNCLLSSGAIPCDQFLPTAVHKPFKSWTASNAQPISFTLTNIHASAAQVVFGSWAGLAEV